MTKEEATKIIIAGVAARDAVRSYIDKNGIAPKKKIPEVLTFQKLEPLLDDDAYYGINTATALQYYLKGMNDNEVPAPHNVYAKLDLTWKEPTVEQDKKEGPAPKPKVKAKKKVEAKKAKPVVKKTGKGENLATNLRKYAQDVAKKIKIPPHGQEDILKTNGSDAEETIVEEIVKAAKKPGKEVKKLLTKHAIQDTVTAAHKAATGKTPSKDQVIKLLKGIKKDLEAHRGEVENRGPRKIEKNLRLMGVLLV